MVMTEAPSSSVQAGSADSGHHDARRWAQWRASWRVALRLARRDSRRHMGRSALIALMVALPVLALVGGAVLYATGDVDHKERLPFALGTAQASLYYLPGASVAVQDANLDGFGTDQTPAKPIPGFARGSEATALSALTRGKVTEVTNAGAVVSLATKADRVD